MHLRYWLSGIVSAGPFESGRTKSYLRKQLVVGFSKLSGLDRHEKETMVSRVSTSFVSVSWDLIGRRLLHGMLKIFTFSYNGIFALFLQ